MQQGLKINGPLSFARFESPVGGVFISAIEGRITDILIGKEKDFFKRAGQRYGILPEEDNAPFRKAFKMLDRYFKGNPVEFDLPLALSGSPFELRVWEAIKSIPWGSTRSYGWIAEKIKSPHSARAVGNACGRNPVPIIIPCHRVVKGDGGPGGYTGGVGIKEALLSIEGVRL